MGLSYQTGKPSKIASHPEIETLDVRALESVFDQAMAVLNAQGHYDLAIALNEYAKLAVQYLDLALEHACTNSG